MEINSLDVANPQPPKRGRPAIDIGAGQRRQVKDMAGLGLRQTHIALIMGMTPKSLRRHFRKELDSGCALNDRDVLQSLFEMATSRRHSAATIFWVKTRCPFDRLDSPEARRASPSSPKPPPSNPAPHSSLDGLSARLNDGAPNGEF
jgi:hypothetical protein